MGFGLAEMIGAGVLLFLGVSIKRQETLIANLATLAERVTHIPTRKEVTDEVAETRHQLRGEIQAVDERVDVIHAQWDGRKS
jgi:hypothetical protein